MWVAAAAWISTMAPNDAGGRGGSYDRGMQALTTFAEELATLQSSPEPRPETCEALRLAGAFPAFAANGGHRGLALAIVQLAHADRLLRDVSSSGAPEGSASVDASPAVSATRDLINQALAIIASAAGVEPPPMAAAQRPDDPISDLDADFDEYDRSRAAWEALGPSAETWTPQPDVDRFFAAENKLLSLADTRSVVLRRQARVLLELFDEFDDLLGPAPANAIANVTQALLVRLDKASLDPT
jgi:hypothetical protein